MEVRGGESVLNVSLVITSWCMLRMRMDMESSCDLLNKQTRKAGKVWSPSLGVGRGDNNCPLQNNHHVTKCHTGHPTRTDFGMFEVTERERKIWNAECPASPCTSSSLTTVSRQLAK
jgi:hypothetical protein